MLDSFETMSYSSTIDNELTKGHEMDYAQTIIEQLGGNKFCAMTGAKNFVADAQAKSLTFKIGKGAKGGVNLVRVTLTAADLYDVEFLKYRALDVKSVATVEGVYADRLQSVFTEQTGFDTHF